MKLVIEGEIVPVNPDGPWNTLRRGDLVRLKMPCSPAFAETITAALRGATSENTESVQVDEEGVIMAMCVKRVFWRAHVRSGEVVFDSQPESTELGATTMFCQQVAKWLINGWEPPWARMVDVRRP